MAKCLDMVDILQQLLEDEAFHSVQPPTKPNNANKAYESLAYNALGHELFCCRAGFAGLLLSAHIPWFRLSDSITCC